MTDTRLVTTSGGGTGTGTQLVTLTAGAPVVTSIGPSSGVCITGVTISIVGMNFTGTTGITLDDTLNTPLTGYSVVSDILITGAVVPAATVAGGTYNVKVTTPNGTNTVSAVKLVMLENEISTFISTGSAYTIEINPVTGKIQLRIEIATFAEDLNLTLSSKNVTIPVSDRRTLKALTGLGMNVTTDKSLQPQKRVKITLKYRDTDVAGIDESKLVIGRYDEAHRRWVVLPTTVFAADNRLEAYTDHFTLFAVLAMVPATDLSLIKPYPNPFTPSSGGSLTFDGVTIDAAITIYTLLGEKVAELTDADADGKILWDGKNTAGNTVATGVYFAVVQDPREVKRLKIAIQR